MLVTELPPNQQDARVAPMTHHKRPCDRRNGPQNAVRRELKSYEKYSSGSLAISTSSIPRTPCNLNNKIAAARSTFSSVPVGARQRAPWWITDLLNLLFPFPSPTSA